MQLPYTEPLTVREPGERVVPEPPRRGEPGGEPCGLCSGQATQPVWQDEARRSATRSRSRPRTSS